MTTKNIQPGYKQTEVGVIPEDWEVVTYGEAFDFLRTATYSRADLSTTGDIGYVHYGDIHVRWKNILDLAVEEIPFIDEEKLKGYSIIKEGDLIVADVSEDYEGVGASVEVINLLDKKVISGLHTFLLRDKNEIFAPKFKAYLHNNSMVKYQMDRLATGLKVYGVSKTNFKLIQIPLPPKSEQTAIATALTDMDALISTQEQLIAKKRAIKQGAMQELLEAKEGWEEIELGDICSNITTGKLDANAMKSNGEFRFYTCARSFYRIDKYAFDDEALLISGNGENVGYVHYYKGKFNAYQRTYVLTGFKENIFFLKVYLDRFLPGRIDAEVNLGNTPYIKMDTLTNMKIKLPPTAEEQTRIAQILSDMDAEIEQLGEELAKYRDMKKGMMEELLTGRKRLTF